MFLMPADIEAIIEAAKPKAKISPALRQKEIMPLY
jgi:hypothetical protein